MCSEPNRRASGAGAQLAERATASARESGGACVVQGPEAGAAARGESKTSDGASASPLGEAVAPSALARCECGAQLPAGAFQGLCFACESRHWAAEAKRLEQLSVETAAQRVSMPGQSPFEAGARHCERGHIQGRHDQFCSKCTARVLP